MQGIGRYRASRLESAPPQQIVLMLFQEAARRLTLAADAIERNDGTVWRPHLHHVREIFLELLSALDDDTKAELVDLLTKVREETGVTTLHITHSQQEARSLWDMLLVMEGGEVRELPVEGEA